MTNSINNAKALNKLLEILKDKQVITDREVMECINQQVMAAGKKKKNANTKKNAKKNTELAQASFG